MGQPTIILEDNISKVVTKSNKLIEANYKLGVVEQKLILCLASYIQPNDEDFKTYTVSVREFYEMLGLRGTPKYSELRDITRQLMQKVFEIRIDNKVIQASWLSYVAYRENEGKIDLRFDPFLKPYLLELKREFTSYKLENVVKLNSFYSIRLYELLKQYEKIKARTFKLSELRRILGAENIYPAYGNFKQRVLLTAQRELEKKTDISFDFEEIKNGRRVEKIKFFIKTSTSNKRIQEEPLPVLDRTEVAIAFVKDFAQKHGCTLKEDIIKRWLDQYGEERIFEVLWKVEGRKDIENLAGYITYMLNLLNKDDNTSANEIAATIDNPDILKDIMKKYMFKKEPLTYWFVEKDIKDTLIHKYQFTNERAENFYLMHKSYILKELKIKEPEEDQMTQEEFSQLKQELEERINKYKENKLANKKE